MERRARRLLVELGNKGIFTGMCEYRTVRENARTRYGRTGTWRFLGYCATIHWWYSMGTFGDFTKRFVICPFKIQYVECRYQKTIYLEMASEIVWERVGEKWVRERCMQIIIIIFNCLLIYPSRVLWPKHTSSHQLEWTNEWIVINGPNDHSENVNHQINKSRKVHLSS